MQTIGKHKEQETNRQSESMVPPKTVHNPWGMSFSKQPFQAKVQEKPSKRYKDLD